MNDYSSVTELPGVSITREALSMQFSRYAFAANLCRGKDVLELGCGSGSGLGYLSAKGARRVIGGDCALPMLQAAAHYYRGRCGLVNLDAQVLPFRDRSFDLVLLFEAIYYLPRPEDFLAEARRVLRPHGTVVICSINREWSDFNPSPFSTRYYSAAELAELLSSEQFEPHLFGGFRANRAGGRDGLVSAIKRTAVAMNLIPKTMKGKRLLKRIFLGSLAPAPQELSEGLARCDPATHLSDPSHAKHYKVVYAVGSLVELHKADVLTSSRLAAEASNTNA